MPEILRMLIIVSTQVIVGHPMGGGFFYGNNMLFPTIATVLLFMYFLTVKISNKTINKIINKLASSSFAVYLIHDNVYIREMLKDVIPQFIQTNSSWFILQYVFVVFVIWLIATLIDFIRQNLFRPINKYLELRCVDREINKMYDTVD